MRVKVRLFASVRQALGRPMLEVELSEAATVDDLQVRLQCEFPQLHLDSGIVLVAVNQRYAKRDLVLREGDEVALIPPVGGG